ncbi:MAG TPA: SagB/ThcOx family dehydrogenase [Trueperaceae bacterium]|nr:SagB/ThcOx family dehydrogenase [Trueperaceae bacterium]
MPFERDKIGPKFQRLSNFRRGRLPSVVDMNISSIKVYANPLENITLPVPELTKGPYLWNSLVKAKESLAEGGQLSQETISQILWASSGFRYNALRTHLTTSDIVGIETYLFALELSGLQKGLYHYKPQDHSLEQITRAEHKDEFAKIFISDVNLDACAAVLIYTGIPARLENFAKSRAYRYLYLEAGAAAQSAMLASVALELSSVFITAFYDDELADLLRLDSPKEVALAAMTIAR